MKVQWTKVVGINVWSTKVTIPKVGMIYLFVMMKKDNSERQERYKCEIRVEDNILLANHFEYKSDESFKTLERAQMHCIKMFNIKFEIFRQTINNMDALS